VSGHGLEEGDQAIRRIGGENDFQVLCRAGGGLQICRAITANLPPAWLQIRRSANSWARPRFSDPITPLYVANNANQDAIRNSGQAFDLEGLTQQSRQGRPLTSYAPQSAREEGER
jgi:hypothetical protein